MYFAAGVALFAATIISQLYHNILSASLIIVDSIALVLYAIYIGMECNDDPKIFRFWAFVAFFFVSIALVGAYMKDDFEIGIPIFYGAGFPITIPFFGALIGRIIGTKTEPRSDMRIHKALSIAFWILEIVIACKIYSVAICNVRLSILNILSFIAIVSIILAATIARDCYRNKTIFKYWCLSSLLYVTTIFLIYWIGLWTLLDPVITFLMIVTSATLITMPIVVACISRLIGRIILKE